MSGKEPRIERSEARHYTRAAHAIAGLLLVGLAGGAYWLSLGFPKPLPGGVSPALFPRIAAAALGAVSLAYLVLTLSSARWAQAFETGASGGRITALMLLFALLIVAYGSAMQPLGFTLATFLFLWASMYLLHRARPWLSGLIAAAGALAVAGLFGMLLNVDLPSFIK
ncbi:MAG: tripartite tricarboxylate transporter TctB family protein [Armatimonadota bacterium]|nr:MAG: tripartite tricarboxylate transporter TctB family protein [Armatimonadota bacterium]